MTTSHTTAHSPPQAEERKTEFGSRSGLIDGIRGHFRRSRVKTMLESAIGSGDPEAKDFDDAMKAFSGLPPKDKEKIMLKIGRQIERCSWMTFESEQKQGLATAIAVFLAESAKQLGGVDLSGEPFRKVMRELKDIVEDGSLYHENDPAHRAVKLACTAALWEMGYGNSPFWEARIRDPATRDYTIRQLLEMPIVEDFKEHGWHLLRENLKDAALPVAFSASPAKIDFYTSMLTDRNHDILAMALAGAIYLNPVPAEFIDIAKDISRLSPKLEAFAECFIAAAQLKPLLSSADDRQFIAASQLVALYARGMPHLDLLMRMIGSEMKDVFTDPGGRDDQERAAQQEKAVAVLAQLHMAGIDTPGFTFNIQYG
ncbi:MAG: hypothetical protein U0R44_05255 [Candidatus Micrarchaeia archaeon]